MLDLFGKKKVAFLETHLEALREELEKTKAARDNSAKELQKKAILLEQTKAEVEDLKRRLHESEEQNRRLREALAQAEKMAIKLTDREAQIKAELEAVTRERDEATKKVLGLTDEIEKLRSALEEAKKASEQRSRAVEDGRRQAKGDKDEVARLKADNEALRKKLAELNERLRVALRKAEHNRRAWLVTQLQLDLAEDRIYVLTHGKPRPVYSEKRRAEVGEVLEHLEAEDVEGFEEDEAQESNGDHAG